MLGFPHTSEGAVMGWIEGKGDNCVDFGLSDYSKDQVRRFVNGKENTVILEFNHDGVIWDKIKWNDLKADANISWLLRSKYEAVS